MTTTDSSSASALRSRALLLRRTAVVLVVVTLLQAGLGAMVLFGTEPVKEIHGLSAMLVLVVAVVVAVAGVLFARAGGSKGAMGHALSLPVIALAQYGLGEAEVTTIHVVLGVAFVAAVIGLFTMSGRYVRES